MSEADQFLHVPRVIRRGRCDVIQSSKEAFQEDDVGRWHMKSAEDPWKNGQQVGRRAEVGSGDLVRDDEPGWLAEVGGTR